MSIWRVNEESPADFYNLLYKEEEIVECGEEYEVEDDKDEVSLSLQYSTRSSPERRETSPLGDEALYDCSPEAPPYSPLTSSERSQRSRQIGQQALNFSASRDRSRSPIAHSSSESVPAGVVLRIFDEDGMPLDPVEDGAFLAPDAHAMYVSPEENVSSGRCERNERSMRGGRGVRGVQGRGASRRGYPERGCRGGNRWRVGHPLNEIWTSDEDVPPELVSLAMDVVRRRQMRLRDGARAESNADRESERENEEDEFFDANDGADGLPRLEGQNLHFEWSPVYESFQGQEASFRPERTGSVNIYNSVYDAFRSYWDDDILGLIVNETNLYATKIKSDSFQSAWFPTNLHEILCLFSFWMMLGIVKMPTITSCFSVDPLLKTEVFGRIFTRKRYEMMNRALSFIDSDPAINDSNPSNTSAARSFDRLHHLRPIITHLNSRFQSNYILNKDICIDESLTLWKGKLNFRQYIRGKAAKFGIKTFELCESATGYLWSFIVYTGKQSAADLEQSPGVLKSTAVVMKLIRPLLNKGYRLFMDNWYNSPLLARFLKLNGTDCVGTLRSSRTDVPVLINKAPLSRGEFIARHSGDVSVLSWQDKKRVTMISTCHGTSTALPTVSSRPTSQPVPFKPQVVLDYNKHMGGVDLKDQMLEPYLLERKRCAKWYMKLFKRLLNISILNSRILLQSSTQKHQDHLVLRLHLVDSILTHHLQHCPKSRRFTVSSSILRHDQPGRYILSTHWPVLLEPTESATARNRNFWKRCVVCLREGRKSQKTSYSCESCRVPLCIKNCFKSYHTQRPH